MIVELRSLYCVYIFLYRGADKSLARPGRKQARKHVRNARDFNNIEMRGVIKFFFLQGKAPKAIHAILRETLASFLPDRAKDLSAPLYITRAANPVQRTSVSEQGYGLPVRVPGRQVYVQG